jgi:hypothetical protein
MNAGNRAPKARNGQRLIWGYEDAGLGRVAKELTPLEKRKQGIEEKEREEKDDQRRRRDARRDERKSSKRDKRSSRSHSRDRDKDRDQKDSRARVHKSRSRSRSRSREGDRRRNRDDNGDRDKYHDGDRDKNKKFDLKEAGRQHRDAIKDTGGAPHSTVEGKSILLNLLQNTLHQNRVLDNEQLDKARVKFRQVDPTSRQDVQLLSKFINSEQARPQTPPPLSPKSIDGEHVEANVSYQVCVL